VPTGHTLCYITAFWNVRWVAFAGVELIPHHRGLLSVPPLSPDRWPVFRWRGGAHSYSWKWRGAVAFFGAPVRRPSKMPGMERVALGMLAYSTPVPVLVCTEAL
jgi:hypothetical protein